MSGEPDRTDRTDRTDRVSVRHLVKGPILTWIALCLVLLITWGYAYLPGAPIKPIAGLSFAAIKATLIVVLFMRLGKSAAIVRLAALAGAAWLSFMFLFTFADLLTR